MVRVTIHRHRNVRDKITLDLHPSREGWDSSARLQSTQAAASMREAGAAERQALEHLRRAAR